MCASCLTHELEKVTFPVAYRGRAGTGDKHRSIFIVEEKCLTINLLVNQIRVPVLVCLFRHLWVSLTPRWSTLFFNFFIFTVLRNFEANWPCSFLLFLQHFCPITSFVVVVLKRLTYRKTRRSFLWASFTDFSKSKNKTILKAQLAIKTPM